MGYTALESSDIGTGKPVTAPMVATIKNDLDYLYGNISGGIETGGLVRNGGFEIDADGDGLPDSVTISLYTGGGATLVTTASTYASPLQGGKSLAISKPSGVGNGGASITFDYMPCSTKSFWARFLMNCNTTGVFNKAQIAYYDKDKSLLATTTPYDSTVSVAGTERINCFSLNTNSSARFARVTLCIGTTAGNSSGLILVDDVRASDDDIFNAVGATDITLLAAGSSNTLNTSTTPEAVAECQSQAFGEYTISMTFVNNSSTHSAYARIHRNTSAVGTLRTVSPSATVTYEEDISGWTPTDKIQVYVYSTTAPGGVRLTDFTISCSGPCLPPA